MKTVWRRLLSIIVVATALMAGVAVGAPRIVVPNGGEQFSEGDIVPIVWTDVPLTDPVTLEYSVDGGLSWISIKNDVTGGVYLWRVPHISGSSCVVRVSMGGISFGLLRTILIGSGNANGSVFTPDGSRVIAGTTSGDVFVYNVADGAQIKQFSAHTVGIIRIDISTDGSRIATAALDGTVKIWSTTDWSLIRVLGDASLGGVYHARFSPDGTEIVAGYTKDARVRVWNVSTGAERLSFRVSASNFARGIDYSRDGQSLLVACSDYTGKVYAASDGHLLFTLTGHTKAVNSIRSSPDASLIATGSFDGTARLWNAKTGAFIRGFLGHSDSVYSVKFDPSGAYIVTAGSDATVRVWSVSDGSQLALLTGHTGEVGRAIFNADGTMISSVATDGTLKLWGKGASDQSNLPFSVVACVPGSVGVLRDGKGKEGIKADKEDLR